MAESPAGPARRHVTGTFTASRKEALGQNALIQQVYPTSYTLLATSVSKIPPTSPTPILVTPPTTEYDFRLAVK
jgi:hypothetical protein